ncbi:MAG: transcriptional repressor [Bacilli bacterium]|nr:transcriptional repressor [Bacilli bacterium]MBN2697103.1 transcriptional repressor [Bacilli bacterium]
MEDLQDILVRLKSTGIKNTKHRIRILEFLNQSHQPRSADEIYESLRQEDSSISLSTVYRAMDILVANELVNKVNFENGTKTSFEINRHIHHHFVVCLGCNKVFSIEGCPIHEYEHELEKKTGFKVVGHKLELYGYCKACQRQQKHKN